MNIRKVAAALALPLLIALTACDGDTPDKPSSTQTDTREYRGGTVTCYDVGSGKTRMGTCDFNAFYQENPELLSDSTEGEEEDVTWVEVKGGSLACIQIGSGSTRFMGCDWLRFEANHSAPR